jgi:hypothetical protein
MTIRILPSAIEDLERGRDFYEVQGLSPGALLPEYLVLGH